jgi:hypothetical protein
MLCEYGRSFVSIHAPAKGATTRKIYRDLRYSRFNPRAHEGRDKCEIPFFFALKGQQAKAWGL